MEGYDVHSRKFPSVKIPRFVSSRTPSGTRRWQENNGAVYNLEVAYLTWTCTQTQITLLPTSSERLSISPALLFTKGQTQRGNSNNAKKRKSKAVNIGGVNYNVKMDLGAMMLTISVSLPKDSKQLCWVNKLQLSN